MELTPEQCSEVEAAFVVGKKTIAQISTETGVPDHRVRQVLRDLGHDLSAARSAKRRHMADITALFAQNIPVADIAERIDVPYNTVRRWLQEEGLNGAANSPRISRRAAIEKEVVDRYRAGGQSIAFLAAQYMVDPRTVTRWLREAGVSTNSRKGVALGDGKNRRKKNDLLPKVLELHEAGASIGQIGNELGVHYSTVGIWLRAEGLSPIYTEAEQSKWNQDYAKKKAQAIAAYQQGMTYKEAAKAAGVHTSTVQGWVRSEGLAHTGGRKVRDAQLADQILRLYVEEDQPIAEICERLGTTHYTASAVLRTAGVSIRRGRRGGHSSVQDIAPDVPKSTCECGKPNYTLNKFCSADCVRLYAKKGGSPVDPANHITFQCENCGKQATKPRSLGVHKYCSNDCARSHTKTKRHVVVGENVLDSTWEVLFYGLCGIHKVRMVRFHRADGVAVGNGFYAPDFTVWLRGEPVAVEIKGLEDPDDSVRWAAYRAAKGRLAVLREEELRELMPMKRGEFVSRLAELATS